MEFKKAYAFTIAFFFIQISCYAQTEHRLVIGEQPILKVPKTTEIMVIDGKMDEAVWKKAESKSLDYFYRVDESSDAQNSVFKMVWDEQNIYVFYEFEDKFLTARETNPDGEPYNDDCAELFIIPAPDSLDSHIGFEVNIYKATNDFVYFNNYYQDKPYVFKAFNPDHQAETTYNGTLNDNSDEDIGWTLELAIGINTFRNLRAKLIPKDGVRWAFQVIRQDRNDAEGSRRSSATLFPVYDISKSVHQANRFGLMEFVDE